MNAVPWPRPISHYDTDGPRDSGPPIEFEVGGVLFRVASTATLASTTLRTRFHVQCRTCTKTLHEATTGPTSYIKSHLREAHGFEGVLGYENDPVD